MKKDSPRVTRQPRHVSSKRIARELGIRPAAVTNWIARGILPAHLLPDWVDHGDSVTPVWRASALPAFRSWYGDRHSPLQAALVTPDAEAA
jgi:hypothetical protein